MVLVDVLFELVEVVRVYGLCELDAGCKDVKNLDRGFLK